MQKQEIQKKTAKTKNHSQKMICVIRIHGRVGLKKDIIETLNRLRLRKKYSCVVIFNNKINLGMVKKVKDFVSFGQIDEKDFQELINKRAHLIDKNKKTELKNLAKDIIKGKKYGELNLKPFFRLHPPRKGIKSKLQYPKGVLGNHKEKINELVGRML